MFDGGMEGPLHPSQVPSPPQVTDRLAIHLDRAPECHLADPGSVCRSPLSTFSS